MNGLEVPAGRYRVPEFGFSSNPPIGSDALALHVAGDRSAGAVVGTNHQGSRPRGARAGRINPVQPGRQERLPEERQHRSRREGAGRCRERCGERYLELQR
ncbi:phage baseplate assembly protein domain-containing protein [Burkholderia cenocepacia]